MIPSDGQYGTSNVCEATETYPSEADLVAKVVEAADAVLGVFEVVVLDETESVS
jgi:hypothetical protein